MKKFLFMVTAAMVLTIQTTSQTIINTGPVSGTWTSSGSPYHIMGSINVPAGNTLIIEPGVTVKIYTNLSFTVYGQLLASGNVSDSILFVPVTNYWKGLQLLNATDTCKFNYCSFKSFLNGTPNSAGIIKGGVIYASNSKILIGNCLFLNNQIIASDFYLTCYGGAICLENSHGLIINSSFINNGITLNSSAWEVSACGGAIYAVGNTIISQNIIIDNTIDIINAGDCSIFSYGKGGGIYIQGNNDLVENNLIQNNSCITKAIGAGFSMTCWGEGHAESFGGGVYGGVIKNNTIINNYCEATGIGYPAPDFWGYGYSECKGGGVYGASVVYNNLINNNTCLAIANDEDGGTAKSYGGGAEGGLIQNNTIINNSVQADAIGGITELYGSGVYNGSIYSCIVYNNIGATQVSGATATYSCIQGGYSGLGNISGDPLFVNPATNDYHLKQPPCQSQLSPCVDAGNPSTPLFMGTTRTDQFCDWGTIDLGFHYPCEYVPFIMANFQAINPISKKNTTVQFMSDCIAILISITEWKWDFQNDGIIDSEQENPEFIYNEVGNYSVRLIINGQDQSGTPVSDTLVKENYIHICSFEAGYDQDPANGWYPLTIQFYDTTQFLNTQIGQWNWDFQNDGIFDSYEQDPVWVYPLPGLYDVKLVVKDTSGWIGDTVLKPQLIEAYGAIPQFTGDPLFGYAPLDVSFTDQSYSYLAGIINWEWDFQNDGVIDSYQQNPSWTYDDWGYKSVMLRITCHHQNNYNSYTLTKQNYITINEIFSGFTQSVKYGHFPLPVNFYDNSICLPDGQINYWQWDFQNDGNIESNIQNPPWIYLDPGIYSVKLIAGNSNYMVYDTILKTGIMTVCNLIPRFYGEPLSGNEPLAVSFYDTSLVAYTQIGLWNWDFQHDGIYDSFEQNPIWTYTEPGIYSIELRITDTSGLIWKSIVKEDYIEILPVGSAEIHSFISNDLKVFPNPFTNDLIIEFDFDKPEVVTIQIFDVAFKPVAIIAKYENVSAGIKNWKWGSQNNNFQSGIYYISITTLSGKKFLMKGIKVE